MKSQLSLLKSFQDIDVSLQQIDAELAAIPARIEEASAGLSAAKESLASKEAEKAGLEKGRREEERELEAQMGHIREREGKLYALKTNKEYQAALKEIADAKASNNKREEAILKLMEGIDTLTKEITQLSGGIADKEKAFREAEAGIKKREAELEKERDEKAVLVKDVEARIDKDVLMQYRYIQGKFSDALSVANRGICGGCNKRVPPQVYIELQKWEKLITCPNCRRILFFEEEEKKDL